MRHWGGIVEARDLSPALPELRPIGNPSYLPEAGFFLDQLRPAGLLQAPVKATKAPAWSFSSNEEFWYAVLHERVRASRVVSLNGFHLSEWIPRSPGLFHTPSAAQDRAIAMSRVIEAPYADELAWIDHADLPRFEREVYGEQGGLKYMRIFDPYGKMSMLRGGVGCIRLRRHSIDGQPVWFMSASSTLTAHEGVPLAVPDDCYEDVIDSLASDGVMYCSSITGTLRYVPDFLGDLYQGPDVPPLYLEVEDLRRGHPPDGDNLSHAMVSVAASFESRSEQLGPPGTVWATYVTFFPGVEGSLQLRRDWLRDMYVGERYQGKVISDFDEQVSRFEGAPFALIRVFERTLDADKLPGLVSNNYRMQEALHRYGSLNVSFAGDLVLGGKNVGESTFINIEHSTIHGPVAKTIQDSFNTVSTASADQDLKTVLGELHKAVLTMLEEAKSKGQLTEEEQAAVARDLESLSNEAVAASPRRKWYQLSAESLKDVAKTLGAIGIPVLELTARVLALLG
jgi:hypothetical protein